MLTRREVLSTPLDMRARVSACVRVMLLCADAEPNIELLLGNHVVGGWHHTFWLVHGTS